MKYFTILLAMLLLCVSTVSAENRPAEPVMMTEVEIDTEAMARKTSRLVQAAVVIEDINVEKRLLTIKNSEGQSKEVAVGPEVKRLNEFKKGDSIVLTYYESLELAVREPTAEEKANPGVLVGGAGKAAKDQKPAVGGVLVAHAITTIDKIDTKNNTVTLKGPQGNMLTVEVAEPKNLSRVKVGDTVAATYTNAIALGIEKKQG